MAPPPEAREENLAGWVLEKEGRCLMLWEVPGGASPSEGGSGGCAACSHRELTIHGFVFPCRAPKLNVIFF